MEHNRRFNETSEESKFTFLDVMKFEHSYQQKILRYLSRYPLDKITTLHVSQKSCSLEYWEEAF
jgi:hypothetical protein